MQNLFIQLGKPIGILIICALFLRTFVSNRYTDTYNLYFFIYWWSFKSIIYFYEKNGKNYISNIFRWYKEDFTENGTVLDFINKYRTNYPVEKMCKSLRVSKNAYYNWLKNKETVKLETAKDLLKKRIRILKVNHYRIVCKVPIYDTFLTTTKIHIYMWESWHLRTSLCDWIMHRDRPSKKTFTSFFSHV